jgi:hypothetical protein
VRLTLRTLLAYLDDTLEPAQAKLIGQKVAESDTAQELIARIKQVTRRRRLTAPPPTGGKVDGNVISGYLDNTLSPEQLAEVEQTCLASDVHLAEMAACHQILTLVLGEPALVPPTAKQRMYALVKGPEAIPFRKPAPLSGQPEEIVQENKETDETLRLGLPALRAKSSWTNRLILLGGGLAVAALLVIAITQILQFERGPTPDKSRPAPDQRAQVDPDKKPTPAETSKERETKTASATKAQPKATEKAPPEEVVKPVPKTEKAPAPMPPPMPPSTDVPPDAPSTVQRVVGQYERSPTQDPSVLLQYDPDKSQWQRLDLKKADVFTGRPLVSLPGYKSMVALKNDLRLTLWGNVPELWPSPPVLESLVELHHHDQLDADLTLRRGRIVLSNSRTDRPARVRIRFENPTNPSLKEIWDLTLQDKDTEVALERWGLFPPGEPFFKDPKNKKRIGPRADLALIVLRGHLTLKTDDLTAPLEAPPKRALMLWNSFSGARDPSAFPKLPEWTNSPLPLPQGLEEVMARARAEFRRARDSLTTTLSSKLDNIKIGLANAQKSTDPSERTLVVRCFAAIDDLDSLLDALSEEKHHEVRQTAIGSLRYWIGCQRDNDYRLYDTLKSRYKAAEAENIMVLLHGFSAPELGKRETYETLIDYLTNPNLAIRELSFLYLFELVPAGRKIAYTPVADSRERERGQREWLKLLESGQIPPRPQSK